MKQIGIGVIGWGFMGRTHTFSIKTMPLHYNLDFEPRLIGICSRRLEKAEQAAREQGFKYAVDDYHKLLADPEIDVVSICTPNNLHEQMALDAIAAGKNVYAYSGYTCEELYSLAQKIPAVGRLLDKVDVLVDGPFRREEKDLNLRFRGSRNQRIIDMKKTRSGNEVILIPFP